MLSKCCDSWSRGASHCLHAFFITESLRSRHALEPEALETTKIINQQQRVGARPHLRIHLSDRQNSHQVTMALPPQHRSGGSAARRPRHQQRKERPRGATSWQQGTVRVLSIRDVGLLEIFRPVLYNRCVLSGCCGSYWNFAWSSCPNENRWLRVSHENPIKVVFWLPTDPALSWAQVPSFAPPVGAEWKSSLSSATASWPKAQRKSKFHLFTSGKIKGWYTWEYTLGKGKTSEPNHHLQVLC